MINEATTIIKTIGLEQRKVCEAGKDPCFALYTIGEKSQLPELFRKPLENR